MKAENFKVSLHELCFYNPSVFSSETLYQASNETP